MSETPRGWKIETCLIGQDDWGSVGVCKTREFAEQKAKEWAEFAPHRQYRVVPLGPSKGWGQ